MKDVEIQEVPSLSKVFRMAVVTGVESAVQVHINRGDDLDARDEKGQTPLMISAARNKAAICKLLLAAGADASLLDPSGRSALGIAHAAGAFEAASAIEETCGAQMPSDEGNEQCKTSAAADGANDSQSSASANAPLFAPSCSSLEEHADGGGPLAQPETAPTIHSDPESVSDTDPGGDGDDFDLTGWEVDEDRPAPEGDPTLSAAALGIQNAITAHQPIDTSADWDDFAVFLPERATPLPRADDVETRDRLRAVLLRAIREGSVPSASIEDLARGDGSTPDAEARALLTMVLNDFGAETDERFEYRLPHESFEVWISPAETAEEADAIDDALAFVDDLASHRNEPLRIYQRELQHEPLLTAQAEMALGQAMESSLEKAIDALALWPAGIGAVLDAANAVLSGAKPLRWISSGPPLDPQDIDPDAGGETGIEPTSDAQPPTEADSANDEDDAESESPTRLDSKGAPDEMAAFLANAESLSHLWVGTGNGDSKGSALRSALASLSLTRGFLADLADLEPGATLEAALAFEQAIKAYRRARDRMTVANLKLVHSIAKRYLFSGQPMDDLLQEGNIGLIKAVDRFDWRRGFRFSTYATWWIRQHVGRYVADKSKSIRLPVHVYEKTQRITHAVRGFELTNGRPPTFAEIAAIVALPLDKVVSLGVASQEPLPIHEIDSLDDQIAADAKEQYTARDPCDIVEVTHLIGAVERLLGSLKHKEAVVMRMRFGIGMHEAMTLEEIGVRLELTRERIRQIEANALRKLKHPVRLDQLSCEFNGAPLHKRESAHDEVPWEEPYDREDDDPAGAHDGGSSRHEPQTIAAPTPENRPSSTSTALAKLLDRARAIGITVEDYQEGTDRRFWVHITKAHDADTRKIIRTMIDLGFSLWPGKGYWR